MREIFLSLTHSFSCLKDQCTACCCVGWKIAVGKEDWESFCSVRPLWLKEDILSHIRKTDKEYFFENRKDGSCAMLDEDRLCRIWRNLSEETLCQTCRKYPRLFGKADGCLVVSMAASCPVVAAYLVHDTVSWEADGAFVQPKDIVQRQWEMVETNNRLAEQLVLQINYLPLLYAAMEKFASEIVDLAGSFSKKEELLDSLSVFASDENALLDEFLRKTKTDWKKLTANYLAYRLVSRHVEFPRESEKHCVRQTLGELFFLRMLAFCSMQKNGGKKAEWEKNLTLVYRFCAHGQKTGEGFFRLTDNFFHRDFLWNLFLL